MVVQTVPVGSNSNMPDDATLAALFGAAVAQHQSGALGEAERGYRRVLALSPDHAEAHGRLAAILLAHGRIADAISHLERASALKPDLFEVQANLGQAYMAAGQAMAAAEALRRALEIRTRRPCAPCSRSASRRCGSPPPMPIGFAIRCGARSPKAGRRRANSPAPASA